MIGRELAHRLVRALLIKGGYELREVTDLVPTLPVFALEQSAWPPYRPFHVTVQRAPVAGQLGACALFLDTTAPPGTRLVLDEVDVQSGETTGLLSHGFISSSSGWALYARASLTDLGEDTPDPATAGIRPLLLDVGSYGRATAGGIGFAAQARIIYGAANTVVRYSRRYPIAVLAPGQAYVLENLTPNVSMDVHFRGRVFAG